MKKPWNACLRTATWSLLLGVVASGCVLDRWDFRPLDGGADARAPARWDVVDGSLAPDGEEVDGAAAADASEVAVAPDVASDGVTCASGQSACGGACVNVQSDPAHCGACGHACPTAPNATSVCAAGQCSFVCSLGARDCNDNASDGCEARTADDPANCGGCGNRCVAGPHATAACAAGSCAVVCEAGWADCDRDPANGCEVETRTAAAHCGGCGMACASASRARSVCADSRCTIACEEGWRDCDASAANGCEAQVQNDPANCGACGNACRAGQVCGGGRCLDSCPPGQMRCGNGCAALASDPNNCGACGTLCPPRANATATCAGGACAVACRAPHGDCDGNAMNGCETPLDQSVRHCGACNNACQTPPHASPVCRSGVCGFTCEAGWADCDRNPSNGCEVDLQNSASHCGACGTQCPARARATAACVRGACAYVPEQGWSDCDGNAANGNETNTASSPSHCGACNRACVPAPGTVASCAGGACTPGPCRAGYADCDRDQSNGCEVTPATDASHCGACGNRCRFTNATATCAGGACALGMCNAGFSNCDGSAANGCETATANDPANCGACGRACPAGQHCSNGTCSNICNAPSLFCGGACVTPTTTTHCGGCGRSCPPAPRATALCVGGSGMTASCALQCESGYGDCDRVIDNGCEEPVLTSVAHCGACNNRCAAPPNASPACRAGQCAFACNAGFGDCDGVATNGCEARLDAVSNCGACGRQCPARPNASPACTSGTCGMVCNPGFADCDGVALNGCEVNLNADPNACGRCGNRCTPPANAAAACNAGTCAMGPCRAGFANCDGSAANGCETNVAGDASNCGACGSRCAFANASAACASGACVLGVCAPGYANCDGSAANGCETAAANDPANCGACGRRCNTAAGELCTGGTCASQCQPGQTFCGGVCAALATDGRNCGACGNVCPTPAHTLTGCAAGACRVASCEQGWGDCDGAAANGCEAGLTADVNHCGRCGNRCPTPPNSAPVCRAGACGYVCLAGYGDCDGNGANGCEVNLAADVGSCGACNARCGFANAAATCSGGACVMGACNAGYASCDGSAANGCETAITTTSNCGTCGRVCPGGANALTACAAGACRLLCNAGWRDCNNNTADGCETSLNTNTNCGACGRTCSLSHATATCATGSCQISRCALGWADADGDDANGCEEPIEICRTCTIRCPIGRFCDCGTCVYDPIRTPL